MTNNLGIQNYGPWYFYVKENQNNMQEMLKIHIFLSNYIKDYYKNFRSLDFINYGRYELVYVLTLSDDMKYTILVNQPNIEHGLIKQEYDILRKLSTDRHIIKPISYYSDGENELYVTPYYEQSRCIGVADNSWGVWVPEPRYSFREFNSREKSEITKAMVSILINSYDEEKEMGISKIRLDGGDFMMEKGYEDDISTKNICRKIKLVAARELINIKLDRYIKYMIDELTTEKSTNVVVGRKIKKKLSKVDVVDGILMGLK